MQYNFPIKILPNHHSISSSSFNIVTNSFQRFGRIGSTVWSMRSFWHASQRLDSVEILRNNNNGTGSVDIELHLRPCYNSGGTEDYYEYGEPFEGNNDKPSEIFKATLLQNDKSLIIPTNFNLNYHPTTVPFQFGPLSVNQYRGYIVIYSPSHCKTDSKNVASSSDTSELSNDFLRLLDNPSSFADAMLKCESAEIPVHKCVLSVRSPVLAAMFTSKMQEGLTSTLLVTDIKLDVLKATLKYIYSGKTDNLTDVLAGDMLFAADKYQLDKLKAICVAKLKSSMKVDNITRILVLGELHDKGLKATAMDFLCRLKCFSDLEESEEWESLEEEYPRLAMEVTKSIVKFLQQTK